MEDLGLVWRSHSGRCAQLDLIQDITVHQGVNRPIGPVAMVTEPNYSSYTIMSR